MKNSDINTLAGLCSILTLAAFYLLHDTLVKIIPKLNDMTIYLFTTLFAGALVNIFIHTVFPSKKGKKTTRRKKTTTTKNTKLH